MSERVPVSGGQSAADLGIQTKGGRFTALIPRGTALPATLTEVFTTADDGQPTIRIDLLTGTTDRAADARTVGHYEVQVPPSMPRGVPQIAVTFGIDTSGAVTLTALDRASGTPVQVART